MVGGNGARGTARRPGPALGVSGGRAGAAGGGRVRLVRGLGAAAGGGEAGGGAPRGGPVDALPPSDADGRGGARAVRRRRPSRSARRPAGGASWSQPVIR